MIITHEENVASRAHRVLAISDGLIVSYHANAPVVAR